MAMRNRSRRGYRPTADSLPPDKGKKTMSGRDPIDVIAAASRKRSAPPETRHIAKAKALAGLFARIGTELEKGRVSRARDLSHRAHALLHVLGALDAQDKYPELRSPRCFQKREAVGEWKRLMRSTKSTLERLKDHYEVRPYAFIRVAPAPKPPAPVPKVAYRGGIYETVFAAADPKAAQRVGLEPSYAFRHGVTHRGYHLSVYDAVQRRLPKLMKERIVPGRMHILVGRNTANHAPSFCELHVHPYETSKRPFFFVAYQVVSTTYAEAAEELTALRGAR